MKKLTTLIAEDSQEQLELIRHLVEDHCPQVTVVAEALTLEDAYIAIKQFQPDLVLLDVEFHAHETSFNLLDRLKQENELSFQVVFFSGHAKEKNYAYSALQYAALQCLQKPIDYRLLVEAVERAALFAEAKNVVQLRAQYEVLMNLVKTRNFSDTPLFIRTSKGKWENVNPDDILYLKSAATVTMIYLKGGKEIVGMELIGYYEFLTENPQFFRVHQSHIVNLKHVNSYDPKERMLFLTNGETLEVARQPDRELRKRLGMRL
ncbi:MAG TPA: hypothetical protein DCR35_17800 [Runella sp.]|nr:hypothetical protein [Runella sp.]HAO50996.1 hypothetical protein [Runella sp.]